MEQLKQKIEAEIKALNDTQNPFQSGYKQAMVSVLDFISDLEKSASENQMSGAASPIILYAGNGLSLTIEILADGFSLFCNGQFYEIGGEIQPSGMA